MIDANPQHLIMCNTQRQIPPPTLAVVLMYPQCKIPAAHRPYCCLQPELLASQAALSRDRGARHPRVPRRRTARTTAPRRGGAYQPQPQCRTVGTSWLVWRRHSCSRSPSLCLLRQPPLPSQAALSRRHQDLPSRADYRATPGRRLPATAALPHFWHSWLACATRAASFCLPRQPSAATSAALELPRPP